MLGNTDLLFNFILIQVKSDLKLNVGRKNHVMYSEVKKKLLFHYLAFGFYVGIDDYP